MDKLVIKEQFPVLHESGGWVLFFSHDKTFFVLQTTWCQRCCFKTNWTAVSSGWCHTRGRETCYVCRLGCNTLPLEGILYYCETQEQLHGLENVIKASIERLGMSGKWVKFQFGILNYPFKGPILDKIHHCFLNKICVSASQCSFFAVC